MIKRWFNALIEFEPGEWVDFSLITAFIGWIFPLIAYVIYAIGAGLVVFFASLIIWSWIKSIWYLVKPKKKH